MDAAISKIRAFIKNNWYLALILGVGIVLMLMPSGKENTGEPAAAVQESPDLQSELAEILGAMDGVGRVKVLLTVAAGEQVIYQLDESSTSTDTVLITDDSRTEQGLIRQVIPPTYRGAIVVCQGADSPAVRLAVVEAVSRVTGLRTDNITVLKMK